MRVLMVTPYPPNRDGIAAYAVQSVRALRAAGHQVEVLSPGPSAAHHHLDLVGPRGALALAKRVRRYDRVIVQFHPDFFYPPGPSPRQRVREALALTVAFRRARSVEVVVHEIDGRYGRWSTLPGQLTRMMWRSVGLIRVHTERDRETFSRNFGVPMSRIAVSDHGADFVPRTHHDRASARASLGVPADAFVFLSIGFIQPHKGFDRAVRAFGELGLPNARLDVVGSVRIEEPAYLAYRDDLAALVASTDGAHLHDRFVSDELFDRWIVAADAVVLPYRSIWSSGVLERARLFGRPVIATAVGGLPEQAAALSGGVAPAGVEAVAGDGGPGTGGADGGTGPGVVLVTGDTELRRAMLAAAGQETGVAAARPWPGPGADLRARVQDEVVMRAAAYRGSRRAAGRAGSGRPGRVELGAASAVSAALRRMRSLELPAATSSRPLARLAKRVVRRLTAWEVEPMVHQLNTLRAAALEAVEAAVEAAVAPRVDRPDRADQADWPDRVDLIGPRDGSEPTDHPVPAVQTGTATPPGQVPLGSPGGSRGMSPGGPDGQRSSWTD